MQGFIRTAEILSFFRTKISELKIQSEQEEQFAKQIKKDLTDLEEKNCFRWESGNQREQPGRTFAADTENRRSAETVSGSGKESRKQKEGLSDRFSETGRNKKKS